MIHFKFTEKDNRYLFIKYDNDKDLKDLRALKSYINLVNPICYLPTFRGIPFTEDFLFEYTQPSGDIVFYSSIGLCQDICNYFKENGIEYDGIDMSFFKRPVAHTFEQFKDIVKSWNLKFEPRPYQYEAAYKILQWKKSVSQLATRAGKTLISYMIFRYLREYCNVKRILMIVPSIDLVKQAYNDFSEYAEFFKTECIWSGGKLVQSADMTVGTFQSLIKFIDKKSKKYDPSFFNGFDCVFVDETHRATGNQIKTIISQPFMKDLTLAFGMTGTLPKEHTIEHYCVRSLLGAKIQEINPKELMDAGYISPIKIYQHRIKYKNIDKQSRLWDNLAEYALSDYVDEKNDKGQMTHIKKNNPKFLVQYEKKRPIGIQQAKISILKSADGEQKYKKFLKDLVKSSAGTNFLMIEKMMTHFMTERIDYLCYKVLPQCPKNTLILCHHVEYIKYLESIIEERFPNRHVMVVYGAVSPKQRDVVKEMLKSYNDCILIASYSCMSTGLTLANLCYGVLFESFKSNVVNMQSLGRGLGLSEMKNRYIVHDIIDVFDKDVASNKIYLQGLAKCKIYSENKYDYEIVNKTI